MPSWNIHTAHAERLLSESGAAALGIRDVDAFLLGNLLPDMYVGYIVTDITRKIPYKDTHFADPNFVPEPDYGAFFELYCAPDADGRVDDLALGTWAHLVADHDYNRSVNAFFEQNGLMPCTELRIKKQHDFELFGRTLTISLAPHTTEEVLRQCSRYRQYQIEPSDVRATEKAMRQIIQNNAEKHIDGTPDYQLLGEAFFAAIFDDVTAHIRAGLAAYAEGDPHWGARR